MVGVRISWKGNVCATGTPTKLMNVADIAFFIRLGQAFGFLSCILFVVDMVLNYKLFQTQRAQETPPDQGPPQRRVWDVNKTYLQSPVFFVKLAEIASIVVI